MLLVVSSCLLPLFLCLTVSQWNLAFTFNSVTYSLDRKQQKKRKKNLHNGWSATVSWTSRNQQLFRSIFSFHIADYSVQTLCSLSSLPCLSSYLLVKICLLPRSLCGISFNISNILDQLWLIFQNSLYYWHLIIG